VAFGTFPRREELTEPEQRRQLLEVFQLPGLGATYLLGCFSRRVTFYSQQVRALNLVDALCKSGVVCEGDEVAVVGAGVAGLTAAAGLALRGIAVRLFEERASPSRREGRMPLQQNTIKRAVHPHIYDWPKQGAARAEAGLPLLDWKAASAQEVVGEIDRQFMALHESLRRSDRSPRIHLNAHATPGLSPRLGPRGSVELIEEAGDSVGSFQAVVFAVGFGLERGHSYWSDDGTGDFESLSGRRKWFVSGTGDGALIDLLRLLIPSFNHALVIDGFLSHIDPSIRLERADGDEFRRVACTIPQTALSVREGLDVWLNCSRKELFGTQSAVLNRLIVAYVLEHAGSSIHFVSEPGLVAEQRDGDRIAIHRRLADSESLGAPIAESPFDGVILRHGPVPAWGRLAVKAACEALQDRWRAWNRDPALDWSKERLFDNADFIPGTAPPPTPGTREKARCAVLHSRLADQDLKDLMRDVLTRCAKTGTRFQDTDGTALEIEARDVVDIDIDEALASPTAFEYAVRTICVCQIVVVDLSRGDPGTALLLGIRAVARRGVTLPVLRKQWPGSAGTERATPGRAAKGRRKRSTQKASAAVDADLPFNLRELSPLVLEAGDTEKFLTAASKALENGMNLFQRLGRAYADVPAYHAVRDLGSDPEYYRSLPPDKQVLVLASHEAAYVERAGDRLMRCLVAATAELKGSPVVTRVVDIRSPLVSSQKVFAELRRTSFVVFDWTGFRFNVFFELGVRLAISDKQPACVLCTDEAWLRQNGWEPPAPNPQFEQIARLFRPHSYGKDDRDALEAFLGNSIQALLLSVSAREPGATWPTGLVHSIVQQAVAESSAFGPAPVARYLTQRAYDILGPDVTRYPDVPWLFARADIAAIQSAGIEHLLAAWYYLDGRHGIQAMLKRDPKLDGVSRSIRDEFVALTVTLVTTLDTLGWSERPLYKEVSGLLDTVLAYLSEQGILDPMAFAALCKQRSAHARKAHDFVNAERFMRDAVRRLESELAPLDIAIRHSARGRELTAALVDAHGTLAGALRADPEPSSRDRKLAEACDAYDLGADLELSRDYGVSGSYCLTQRLVTRFLIDPGRFGARDWTDRTRAGAIVQFPRNFEEAEQLVRRQLVATRQHDPWAMADHALLLLLLLARTETERAAWDRLTRAAAPSYVLVATKRVVDDLLAACSRSTPTTVDIAAEYSERLRWATTLLGASPVV
jgi:hypothetical protein